MIFQQRAATLTLVLTIGSSYCGILNFLLKRKRKQSVSEMFWLFNRVFTLFSYFHCSPYQLLYSLKNRYFPQKYFLIRTVLIIYYYLLFIYYLSKYSFCAFHTHQRITDISLSNVGSFIRFRNLILIGIIRSFTYKKNEQYYHTYV